MSETTYTDEKLASMLGKVQNLLARADHPNTPPAEAETARTMAAAIMAKYRIEEETVRQTKIASGTAAKPVVVEFDFMESNGSPYTNHYYSFMHLAMNHTGVRGDVSHRRVEETDADGRVTRVSYHYVMTMVGFDSDVQLTQLLYTNLRLAFQEKLEPKLDRSLSEAENVYRLRNAGMERNRISALLWPGTKEQSTKVTRLYAEACAARGEDPKVVGRSVNVKTFRESYADAFLAESRNRLRRMRTAEAQEAGAIVLVGREDAVNEAFYEQFPHLRPAASLPGKYEYKPCEKCAKAKSGSCRAHSYRAAKPRAFSTVGWNAGTHAAQQTDLSRAAAKPTGKLN